MKKKLETIFNYYGYIHQMKKLAEECSELIRSIVRDDDENFIEELADVSVLTDQFLNHFPTIKEKFEKIKQEKVDRQIARIRNTKRIYRLKTK